MNIMSNSSIEFLTVKCIDGNTYAINKASIAFLDFKAESKDEGSLMIYLISMPNPIRVKIIREDLKKLEKCFVEKPSAAFKEFVKSIKEKLEEYVTEKTVW